METRRFFLPGILIGIGAAVILVAACSRVTMDPAPKLSATQGPSDPDDPYLAESHGASRSPSAKAEVSSFLPTTQGGVIWFTEAPRERLRIQGEIVGLDPRKSYALTIHEVGSCTSPEATGETFDPGYAGRRQSGERRRAALPPIRTDRNGIARFDFTASGFGARNTGNSVVGRSIVLHAGNAEGMGPEKSAEIACGVIQPTGG